MLALIFTIVIFFTLLGIIPTMRLRRGLAFAKRGKKEIFMAILFVFIAIGGLYMTIWSIFFNSEHTSPKEPVPFWLCHFSPDCL